CFGIGRSTIPCHSSYMFILLQPILQRCTVSSFQYGHGLMGFSIYNDSTIRMPLFKCKIVYPDDRATGFGWLGGVPFQKQTNDGVPADFYIHGSHNPGTGFAACFNRKNTGKILEAVRHPAIIVEESVKCFSWSK